MADAKAGGNFCGYCGHNLLKAAQELSAPIFNCPGCGAGVEIGDSAATKAVAASIEEIPPAPRSPLRLEIPPWLKDAVRGLSNLLTGLLQRAPSKPAEPSLARRMAEARGQERAATFYTPGGVVGQMKADPWGHVRAAALVLFAILVIAAFFVIISLS